MRQRSEVGAGSRGVIWRHVRVGAAIGCCGLVVALGISSTDPAFDASLVLLAAICASLAGLICAGLFGRPGRAGWGLALLGAGLVTLLSGWLAGIALVGGLDLRAFAGPLFVFGALAAYPLIGLTWLVMMVGAHFWARGIWSK